MLKAVDVSFSRGKRQIISNVNLDLRAGELTAVIGPNGAGKSTLLKLLAGAIRPSGGNIWFDGKALQDWRPKDLATRRAVLSQSTTLVFPFTVREVISLGLPDELPRNVRSKAISSAMHHFQLQGFEDRLYQNLSGGEQQRVQLTRVVCQLQCNSGPGQKLLFLDEPVSNLDIKHQIGTLVAVRELLSPSFGAFIILHDLNLAAAYADRIVIIHDGRVVANDSAAAALTSAALSKIFDVELKVVRNGQGRRILFSA